MTRTVIIYKSKYGATARYAALLSEMLGGEALEAGGDAAIVESYISYLRKKVDGIVIEDENGDKHKVTPLIETKRGIGYMIRAPKN